MRRHCVMYEKGKQYVNFKFQLDIGIAVEHGLRTPNEAFFHRNPELLGLGRQIGQINAGAFRVLSPELSAPILVQ